jgi:hypothetical protein
MMTRLTFGLIALSLLAPAELSSQSSADSAGIRQAALNYIEGWFSGDAARMERALHPRLAKRIVRAAPEGPDQLVETSALELVQQTRRGGGGEIPAERRRTDVRILDVFGNAASARVDAGLWIDYLHLVRWNGDWRIVNVLWELRPEGG